MKNLTAIFYSLVLMLFIPLMSLAQAPQKFNYQAIARDAAGEILANQAVGLKASILQGGPTGTVSYAESQSPTTDQFGHFSLEIGDGTVLSGSFPGIDWGHIT